MKVNTFETIEVAFSIKFLKAIKSCTKKSVKDI